MMRTMLHTLGSGERLVFSARSPLGYPTYEHLVFSQDGLLVLSSSPDDGIEFVMPLPMAASCWITDAIHRLLSPASAGGVPGDVMAIDWEPGAAPLRLRRAAQVEAAGEPGFSVIYRGRRTFRGGGFDEITWSDRMLFDAGLYRALVGIAVDWARATGHEPPLDPLARIRPHWMGARVGDTPPPAPE